MKIACVYIFPQNGANGHFDRAVKFLQTYAVNPPGMDHETVIMCNETPANDETKFLFAGMPGVQFINHDGSGMDCGAYQLAARSVPCDLMVFFGGNTYFRRPGWLNQMVWAYQKFGDTLYGSTGNQGDMRFQVYPHVRTTGFWCSPNLINAHPLRVTHNGLRYPYEHGPQGLTTWILNQNKMAYIVAWDGAYPVLSCDLIPNGFHQGDQSNVLVGDRLTCEPYYPYE